MDVLLINPNPGGSGLNESTIEPPIGLGYIAAILEKNSFECKIIDANVLRLANEEIIKEIPAITKIVGIYLNSFSFNSVKELTEMIRKKDPNTLIMLGGPLPTAAPEITLREISCDGIIRGEGEYSCLMIITNLYSGRHHFEGDIPGLAFLGPDNSITYNAIQRIDDLDRLPFPSYHIYPDMRKYKSRSRKKPLAAIVTSRGCPYQCTFCSKDIFQNKMTIRSAKNVLEEIDYLVKEHGVKQIDILDDNFALNKKRLKDILNGLIQRKYDLVFNFQSGITTEVLDDEILKMMKEAGVYKLSFGIESADEELLRLHKKKINLKKIEEVVKTAKKMGFLTYGFFIVGLLGETEEGFNRTLDFARKIDLDVANFCMAVPFVGTGLYRMVEEQGQFIIDTSRNIDSGFYDNAVFYIYGEYSEGDIVGRYQRAYKEFYTVRKQLKVVAKIRSIYEVEWLIGSFCFVIKGMLRDRIKSIFYRGNNKHI
jgi:radical SAM superfamily enzyme YgiQ (UPF0313 family)